MCLEYSSVVLFSRVSSLCLWKWGTFSSVKNRNRSDGLDPFYTCLFQALTTHLFMGAARRGTEGPTELEPWGLAHWEEAGRAHRESFPSCQLHICFKTVVSVNSFHFKPRVYELNLTKNEIRVKWPTLASCSVPVRGYRSRLSLGSSLHCVFPASSVSSAPKLPFSYYHSPSNNLFMCWSLPPRRMEAPWEQGLCVVSVSSTQDSAWHFNKCGSVN